ncbi:unnamed protein product (macronuclear) [Paramecium tetraurelia]|uniref:PSI domain-containing protein n=1 Tax=Paramecium tetraurelia TaxID=5888 RepID=A0C5K2_PARTE|nr:uncharacterized protein GSPATT00035198001 [Paramecium tetraurelia]CAK66069.1 unnamed protein product [Paramecium tetraurelia]|eukprot:XP_001433466.1 hypothetical protein (macronuclear) [Paramecium tetraurelia strain d4-2]
MNKLLIFVSVLLFINCETIRVFQPCKCIQMLTQVDCSKKEDCIWDKQKNECIDYTIEMKIQHFTNHATYCNQHTSKEICVSIYQCSWDDELCTHFTGCTAFVYDTHEKCKAISHRCISDGLHCVELGDCNSYLSSISCIYNSVGQYCYWNATQSKCQDVDECSKLPQTFASDSQCRSQFSTCTAQIGGGCIEEGNNCQAQDDEINCVYNQKNKQICFWLDGKCFDKICENAPLNLTTDKECQDFLPSCTTKQDGGCITRLLCSTNQTKEACNKDAVGNDCYWTGNKCVDKTCENALKNYKTNEECQVYLNNCITNGQGCVLNTSCGAAIIEEACDKTINGKLCHWDGSTCLPKTCKNAGPSYIGHVECSKYMETCTASTDEITGCTDRTCDNAPVQFNTYTQCLKYLQNGNCIPKNGGGCIVNTNCENINMKEGCVRDANNQECFWWKDKCQLKICENAPIELNTHEQCKEFMQTCTIGSDQRCVSLTCENVQERSNCNYDLHNKLCVFNEGCFKKFCALAPKNLLNFNQCQSYLSSCTVDNSGSGCMELPITCNAITRREGCYLTSGQQECGWYNGECIDKSCQTAPPYLSSTFECNNYMVGCVVKNDRAGCMKPPNSCQQRELSQNCEYEQPQGLKHKCFWGQDQYLNGICLDIKCENVHLSLGFQISQDACWNFFGLKCILDYSTYKCIIRPNSCLELGFQACTWSGVLEDGRNCYWDIESSSCRSYQCSSISIQIYSHDLCNQIMQQCTVNYYEYGCTDLLECSQYGNRNQCVLSKDHIRCVWVDSKCIDIPCEQDTESWDFQQCQNISKNCVPTSKKCYIKKSRCEDIKQKNQCEQATIDWRKYCIWNGTSCESSNFHVFPFDCSLIRTDGLTQGYCQSINQVCSVNKQGTSCIQSDYCYNYTEDQCFWGLDGECIWYQNLCRQNIYCEYAKPPYTYDTCRVFNYNCTVKIDGSGCVETVYNCQNTPFENCTNSLSAICYKKYYENVCINAWQQPLQSAECTSVQGKGLTFAYCLKISQGQCSVNTSETSCITMRGQCQEYSQEECVSTNYQKCIYSETLLQCIPFYIGINSCSEIKLYQLEVISDLLCREFHDSCRALCDGSGCYSNYILDCDKAILPFTYYNCFVFSQFCSVNVAKTQCIPAKNTCTEYSLIDCVHAIDEGECMVVGESCVQKGCDYVSNRINTPQDCYQISANCGYRDDGCQKKRECSQYLLKKSCIINQQDQDCLWNPNTAKCVNKSCENAEASEYFDSHEECIQVGRCTVKASNDVTVGQGCISWGPCRSYVIQEQCVRNLLNEDCIWNTNVIPAKCSDKSCETAELFRDDHVECQLYLNKCTVRVIEIDGIYVSQGCISLKLSCNQYTHQNQCIIDASGNICGWNGNSCENQSCKTVPTYLITPQLCQQYFENCTINSTDSGCTQTPDTCEEMTQNQCYYGAINIQQQECLWDQSQMKCILKTCELIPISYSEYECSSFLNYCTMSAQRCRNAICEDFSLALDEQCSNIMSTCTTNGVYCVKRGSCLQAQSEAGCVTDVQGRECAWINTQSHCIIKSCETAPLDFNTEQLCQGYFKPKEGSCTTTKSGGCVLKGTCFDANIQAACTTSNIGELCVWDEILNICRIKQCQDYLGSTHKECQSKRQQCTVGLGSRCVNISTCQDTKFKAACIEGTDGPCLWISRYKNKDNTLGACFRYDSCQSLKWNSHALCQEISAKCTTDGDQCVPITNCNQTNLKGCVIGVDNKGIQTCIVTTESLDSKQNICKLFNKCTDIYYLTHEQCQQASSQCTSDYQNGCISLKSCFEYKNGQCHINNMGILKDGKGQILSTGICVWDQMQQQCRDEDCSDLPFITHLECQSRLTYCTTNGKKCILKEQCLSYLSQDVCQNAEGLDGKCFWETAYDKTLEKCRKMECEDIPNGYITSSCRVLENCISDGLQCISKVNCSYYKFKQSCNSQGQDGICVWIETTEQCKLMENCESANQDQNACKLAKDRCYWESAKSLCQSHTCQTYFAQVGRCKNFYSWDYQNINLCHYLGKKCVSININTLKSQDCYIKTAEHYRWDPYKGQCTSCEKSVRLITEFSDILGHLLLILFILIY